MGPSYCMSGGVNVTKMSISLSMERSLACAKEMVRPLFWLHTSLCCEDFLSEIIWIQVLCAIVCMYLQHLTQYGWNTQLCCSLGFYIKHVGSFNQSSSKAADWSIFTADWEHRVALSGSTHSKEIVSFLAGYGFASMQQQQKGLEMTSVDSEWWLMCLWREDKSLNAVKSQLTWQSQLVCSLNQSTPEIHNTMSS